MKSNTKRGMTLVEVLMATFIMAFVLGIILLVMSAASRRLETSQNMTNALHQGREQMEELYGLRYDDPALTFGSHPITSSGSVIGQYVVASGGVGKKQVNIAVWYNNRTTGNSTTPLALSGTISKAIHREFGNIVSATAAPGP